LFRGIAFHPASREEYWSWLARTPWRYPKPLPYGPVHVVAQDLFVLALFEVLLLDAGIGMRLLIPAVFLFLVSSCWALLVWSTASRSAAYGMGYALGATLWVASVSTVAAGICLVLTYAFSLHQLRRSFATFPWAPNLARRKSKTPVARFKLTNWGWSFDVLSPQRYEQLPLSDRLFLSGMTGWFAFAIFAHSEFALLQLFTIGLSLYAGAFYGFFHCVRYVWSHSPPISVLGRLLTGRLIIPSYDIAFVPIVYSFGAVILALFLVGPMVKWPVQYVVPVTLTLYLFLMNLACPDVDKWRLTCKARMSPWAYTVGKREYEQL
jgi:hypothetical protein